LLNRERIEDPVHVGEHEHGCGTCGRGRNRSLGTLSGAAENALVKGPLSAAASTRLPPPGAKACRELLWRFAGEFLPRSTPAASVVVTIAVAVSCKRQRQAPRR
jgi:hypothetical protein